MRDGWDEAHLERQPVGTGNRSTPLTNGGHMSAYHRVVLAGLTLALAVPTAQAQSGCTLRRSLFYTQNCPNQVCTYAMETVVCDGEVHWHGHFLGCNFECPARVE